ncbi:MAG: hypothetical protein ACI8W7_003873 [Gammaproteobacteria bacterium]|jgi:hypothetical protein
MPNHLKALISVLALILSSVVFYLDSQTSAGAARWVALGLGPLMVFAIWIFPEAKLREIRADAAQQRSDSER